MRPLGGWIRVCVGLGLGMVLSLRGAPELRVVGSDLLGTEWSRTLLIAASRVEVPLTVAFDGSRPGLGELRAGRAQLALVSLPAADEAGLAEFISLPLAWHRVVVLVPVSAPLNQLTLSQLAGIFGREARDDFQRWGELGVAGAWQSSPIRSHAPVAGSGLVLEIFRSLVLGAGALKSQVEFYRAPEDLVRQLAGESRVMALAGALPPGAVQARVLAVAVHEGEPAFAPTAENLDSGDYPLRLPLRVVFSKENLLRVAPVVRILMSDESAVQLERAGLAALPSNARHRELRAFEKSEREILRK